MITIIAIVLSIIASIVTIFFLSGAFATWWIFCRPDKDDDAINLQEEQPETETYSQKLLGATWVIFAMAVIIGFLGFAETPFPWLAREQQVMSILLFAVFVTIMLRVGEEETPQQEVCHPGCISTTDTLLLFFTFVSGLWGFLALDSCPPMSGLAQFAFLLLLTISLVKIQHTFHPKSNAESITSDSI
jgi:hypothetical protein